MAIIRQYDETNFVTSLRAIAATMVVMIHTGAFKSFGGVAASLTHAGKYGVEIFFVISGFSIAVTFCNARSYSTFLVRRLFRIAPLYVLVLSAIFAGAYFGLPEVSGWLTHFGTRLDAYNYGMHLAFLSCLDQTIANSVVGVEWSIPVEVFWYAALPAVLAWATNDRRVRLALLLSVVAVAATKGLAQLFIAPRPDLFAKWFPTTWGPFFLLGVVSYRLRQTQSGWYRDHADRIVAVCVAVFLGCLLVDLPGRRVVMSLTVCLMIGLFERDRFARLTQILEFRPLLFLGTISYSLYLTHIPVQQVVSEFLGESQGPTVFAATLMTSIALSTVLYLVVEAPANRLGRLVVHSAWLTPTGVEADPDAPDETVMTPFPSSAQVDSTKRAA